LTFLSSLDSSATKYWNNGELSWISTGIISSDPYTRLKGVSLVVDWGVDRDQAQQEEVEDEDAQKDIRSSSFSPQRITRSKFKQLGSSGQMFSLFVISFV